MNIEIRYTALRNALNGYYYGIIEGQNEGDCYAYSDGTLRNNTGLSHATAQFGTLEEAVKSLSKHFDLKWEKLLGLAPYPEIKSDGKYYCIKKHVKSKEWLEWEQTYNLGY
jgi:hypothetical protein